MTKYRITIGSFIPDAEIKEVYIERETESLVWINGRRNAKRSEYHNFYDTWQEAKDALQKCVQGRVDSLRQQLERANSALENIKGMSC